MIENNYPDTIKNPEAFNKKLPAGFDGVFDWSWTQGCFGDTKIEPMDFDGVVERKKHYLVFETKDLFVDIKEGQEIALANLNKAKTFTVIKIWGKDSPEYAEILYHNGKIEKIMDKEKIIERVKAWYKAADSDSLKEKKR